jgi:predicted SnoaL-like aldol condensation-catalyzing enzyme
MNNFKLCMATLLIMTLSACDDSETAEKTKPPISAVPCTNVSCEDNNKVIIEQIYSDIINGKNSGLVTSIYNENFIQHNTAITAGINGQVDYFTTMAADRPNYVATIKHIVGDGDYVAVHWHYSNTPENEFLGQARIDLYKLSDDLVIEHWDVTMVPNEITASGNSVFSDLYEYSGTEPNNDVAVEETNKTMITTFYLDLFNNLNIALVDQRVDENYLQHNFWVPNGSSALRDFVSGGTSGDLTIFLTLGEDDLVWTFSGTGKDNLNTVDLWRVDNNIDKIVEHWDVF